jgi:hypothetical protein
MYRWSRVGRPVGNTVGKRTIGLNVDFMYQRSCVGKGWKEVGKMKRHATDYPGVFFREVRRIGGKGIERVYYVVYKKDGKVIEEKVGYQYRDDMTPARASGYRAERIEGKRQSRKEIREALNAKEPEAWTVDHLWQVYIAQKTLKGFKQDECRYKNYIKNTFGDKEPKDILPLDVDRVRLRDLKGKSPQTIKLTLRLLQRLCNFGVRKKLCSPMTFKVEVPKVNNLKTEDLSSERIKRLIDVIERDTHPQAGDMMKMALFTGMRRGELFKLKWGDVDFDRGFITIRDPKGVKDQMIPLNEGSPVVAGFSVPKSVRLSERSGGRRVFRMTSDPCMVSGTHMRVCSLRAVTWIFTPCKNF